MWLESTEKVIHDICEGLELGSIFTKEIELIDPQKLQNKIQRYMNRIGRF